MMDTLQKNSRSVLILHREIKNCIVYFPRLPSLSNRMHNCWLWSSARSSVGGYLQWSIASKNWRRLADARGARGVIGRILAITQTCLITSFLFRICGVKTFITKSVGSEFRSYNTGNHRQFYITCPVGIGLGCISKWLGWIPTVAPLRASTSPLPPLPYFQHIKLSVPKRKIWYTLNNHLQLHLYFLPLFSKDGHAGK